MTVVIPCRNEERAMSACLDSVLAQTLSDIEVLVVDGRSTDATRTIVAEYAAADGRVRLIDNPRCIVPTALNIGLREARGHWLVRVDAHCVIPNDYVARLVALLETGVGGAGGRKLGRGHTPTGRAIAAAMSSKAGVGGSAYHHDGDLQTVDHVPFGAYPVGLAREIGGWDERLSVNQDFEFDVRIRQAGHELLLDPSVVIDWESRQTIGALFRQYRRYGRGKTRVIKLHPNSVRARHLAAPALVAGVVGWLLLSPWRPWRNVGALVMTGYVALVTVAGMSDGRSLPALDRPKVTASLVAMHAGWGIGFWEGVVDHLRNRDDLAIVDAERALPSGRRP